MIHSLEPPILASKPPSLVYAARGTSLSLCCEAVGSPLPKVEWLRPQKTSDSLLTVQEKGCLEVNTIKYNSEGEYICRATNHFGRAETTTAVIIGWLFCCCFVLHFISQCFSYSECCCIYFDPKHYICRGGPSDHSTRL